MADPAPLVGQGDSRVYVPIPLAELSWWERFVERATGWTRMGPQHWTFCDDRWWDHDIEVRPSNRRESR